MLAAYNGVRVLFGVHVLFGTWTLYVWPSSIFLLATDGHEHDPSAVVILAMSFLANGILYGVGGALVWGASRAFHHENPR